MACFALVPAAGGGAPMGAPLTKQYQPLAGPPLIHHPQAAQAPRP
ncbi:MAG: 2-C-methyl-D-erythritol 4-phosphate cytidylyltransferase, partial [Rhodocyclaceae bacterium]|nr:2-C-methyl-D-erythritol 4-phosphate cytidylyltransferase [Rhodocyclaceae bacterium]